MTKARIPHPCLYVSLSLCVCPVSDTHILCACLCCSFSSFLHALSLALSMSPPTHSLCSPRFLSNVVFKLMLEAGSGDVRYVASVVAMNYCGLDNAPMVCVCVSLCMCVSLSVCVCVSLKLMLGGRFGRRLICGLCRRHELLLDNAPMVCVCLSVCMCVCL